LRIATGILVSSTQGHLADIMSKSSSGTLDVADPTVWIGLFVLGILTLVVSSFMRRPAVPPTTSRPAPAAAQATKPTSSSQPAAPSQAGDGWEDHFSDGHVFCNIIHKADPTAIDLEKTKHMEPEERLQTAFDAAHASLGVPKLLEPSDFRAGPRRVDKRSVVLYVAKLKQAHDQRASVCTPSGGASASSPS
jgi:hypothetical protein